MSRILPLAALVLATQLTGCAAVVVGGAATGVSVATDRRTAGVYLGDQEIELRATNRLSETFPKNHISTTSYNRQVLLTGQVHDEATKTRAAEIVRGVPDVRTVFNELAISGPISVTADANDVSITTQVKARMLRDDRVPGVKVKVVTEAGVVYLMGLLTHAEADAAAEVASTTSGVTRVVTLFEYIAAP